MDHIEEPFEVTWVLLAVLVCSAAYWVLSRCKSSYSGYKLPPYPAPRKFLMGHIHLWAGKDQLESLKTFREAAGDLYSLDFFGNLVIVINGYENIKKFLVKHSTKAPDRPIPRIMPYLYENNHGTIDSVGENWKQQRMVSLHTLRAFGMGKNILAERILEEVAVYTDKLASFNAQPEDIREATTISVSNVICSIIVGKRFSHDDPHFIKLMANMDYFFTKAPNWGIMESIPFVVSLPGDWFGIKSWLKHIIDINENFSRAQINEAKKTFNQNDEPKSFIAAYLQKRNEEISKGIQSRLDEKNLVANIRGLFVAGTETTSSTICWCVLLCLHHPDVQEKMFEEITTQAGQDRLPNMKDRPQLRYLEAVIRETQRYASLAALMMRKVIEDFEINGYTVPKGSTVFVNMRSAHRDKHPWGDPDKFRPERFLDSTGNLINSEQLTPFGLGPRACLGEAMAKMELFLFLAAMFQRFRFEPETPGELPTLKEKLQMMIEPLPFKVRAVPRRSEV